MGGRGDHRTAPFPDQLLSIVLVLLPSPLRGITLRSRKYGKKNTLLLVIAPCSPSVCGLVSCSVSTSSSRKASSSPCEKERIIPTFSVRPPTQPSGKKEMWARRRGPPAANYGQRLELIPVTAAVRLHTPPHLEPLIKSHAGFFLGSRTVTIYLVFLLGLLCIAHKRGIYSDNCVPGCDTWEEG